MMTALYITLGILALAFIALLLLAFWPEKQTKRHEPKATEQDRKNADLPDHVRNPERYEERHPMDEEDA